MTANFIGVYSYVLSLDLSDMPDRLTKTLNKKIWRLEMVQQLRMRTAFAVTDLVSSNTIR